MMLVYSALPWLQDDEPFGDLPEMRTEIVTPSDAEPMSFAFSPDGRQITFVASDNGVPRLWLRSLASSIAQPLAGTEGALSPFWSPDSRSIGFLADGKVKRLDLGSGVPQTLASIGGTSRGATWSRDGVVLFPTSTASGLVRVSALGGAVTPVTKLEGTVSHRYPYFLPDGRHFIFYALAPQPRQGIYLGSLDSSTVKLLTQAETAGIYTKNGWLLWVRGGALIARRLDVDRGELVGSQLTIADPIAFDAGATVAAVSASADGLIAYRAGAASRHQLVWFDRAGKMLGPFAKPDDTFLSAPRLSPDGKRVAVWRVVQGNADIWILDGARMTRFTFDGAQDRYAVWSSDGTGIFFDSTRDGGRDIYVKRANGADGEEVLLESSSQKAALSASGDGKFLLYGAIDEKTNWDLWVLPLTGERKPRLFLKTNFAERTGHFSPDGRWIAYASDESGRFEVYVRPFVDNGAANSGEWQVSTNGGVSPRWRDDGKELYYVAPDGTMMAAPITTGATFESGTPTALFRPRIWGAGTNPDLGRQFDVASDGRFLVNVVLDESAAPITILQNWKPPTN
jgi:Tol biopolymer transport system component